MYTLKPYVHRYSATILALVMTLLNANSRCFAQDCDDCSRPRIALYDFAMQVAMPQSDTLIIKWMDLFWTGIQARSLVRQNETNSGCLVWLDGAVINAATLQGGMLKFGTQYTNLPPPGAMSSVDYILSGYTMESAGGYKSVLTLEAAESREMVKSVSVDYDNVAVSASAAGTQLAAQFGSIFTVIKEFERYKRDTDTYVAIRDLCYKGMSDEVQVKPARTSVAAGETVDVEITLIDCDDVPLKDRILYLTAITIDGNEYPGPENGHFTESQVTTDAEGKAKAKFVPSAPGLAVCQVNFPHKKPTGRKDGFIGTAYINVPTETQQFNLMWSLRYTCKGDTSFHETSSDGSTLDLTGSVSEQRYGQFHVKGLLERNYSITGHKAFRTILSATGTGNFTGSGNANHFCVSTSPGGGTSTHTRTNTYKLGAYFDKSHLDFSVDLPAAQDPADYPEGAFYFRITGEFFSSTENCYDGSCESYSGPALWEDTGGPSLGVATAGETHERTNNSFTKTHYRVVTKTDDHDFAGHLIEYTVKMTFIWDWTVTITPYEGTTAINDESAAIPRSYLLEQNYPNPFNPSTRIKYTIGGSGVSGLGTREAGSGVSGLGTREAGSGVSGLGTSKTSLIVYDLLGREVAVLVNERKAPGSYEVTFDAGGLASGVYFYRMQSGDFTQTRKLCVVR